MGETPADGTSVVGGVARVVVDDWGEKHMIRGARPTSTASQSDKRSGVGELRVISWQWQ